MLAPGTYHVGVAEHNTNIGLANSDNVFNSNTVLFGFICAAAVQRLEEFSLSWELGLFRV